MAVYMALALIPLTWLFINAYRLLANYRRAPALHGPLVLALISPDNPIWIALQTALPCVFRHIPFQSISFLRYSRLGWEFHDRYKTHQRLGDAWVLVTPDRNWLYVAQAEAACEIFARGRDFGRPVFMLASLNVFGPNVSTAEGTDWQRQRKMTATPFNELKSSVIWAESMRQANDMLQSWLSYDLNGLKCTADDTRTLALHVLAYAGFQRSYPFQSAAKENAVDQPSTYRDSLSIILKNIFMVMILPTKAFQIPFLPSKWRRIGWAVTEFRRYMLAQLAEEKNLMAEGKPGSGTLMSNLVRASSAQSQAMEEATNQHATSARKADELKPLTVDEILGNIFVFNFAGHDTTAISLGYSILLLVARPDVQDWLAEELNFYLDSQDNKDWKYDVVFPKLKRCLAVLLETLRLYNPLPGVPKYTGAQPQSLRIGNHNIHIPENTLVIPNLMALHTHPRYWGSDSLTWEPSRWIQRSSESPAAATADLGDRLSHEQLLVPERDTFIAWSEGARNCPGKRFAQVEFVATMAVLFRNHRVQPVPRSGESRDQARGRVLNVVKDSNVELLLQMRDPDSVVVTWSRR